MCWIDMTNNKFSWFQQIVSLFLLFQIQKEVNIFNFWFSDKKTKLNNWAKIIKELKFYNTTVKKEFDTFSCKDANY